MRSRRCGGSLARGVILLFIGIVFLMVNIGIVPTLFFRTWWPLLLIVAGVVNLLVYGLRLHGPRPPYDNFA